MHDNPVIVIGSGPAGVQATEELVTRGVPVLMLDGGRTGPDDLPEAPTGNFEDVRRTWPDQATWFLGKDRSGIPVSGLTGGLGGGQVSGNRAYVIRDASEKLPIKEENCQIVQSLATGGLGAAWGAACAIPEDAELRAMGLDPALLSPHFTTVIKTIGISGSGAHPDLQPALPTDLHGSLALEAYQKRRAWFEQAHLSLGQPLSAILTRDLGERRASTLSDMDYWADAGKSVYRPQFTLESLLKNPLFRYEGRRIVKRIITKDGTTNVEAITDGNETVHYPCRHAVLAAGAVGSARITLESLPTHASVPFSAKPHMFTACVHVPSLGKAGPKERISFCQLVFTDDEKREGMRSAAAQLYSYRSLMLFRLLTSQPLPCPEAIRLLAALTPALVIADIRFPALPRHGRISRAQGGRLDIACIVPEEERVLREKSWKRVRQGLRKLGMLPVRNMVLPEGSASHYGGTLPCTPDGGDLTTDTDGLLRGLQNVSVADAAVFPVLPAVPHTLTIMANARRVAAAVHQRLQ